MGNLARWVMGHRKVLVGYAGSVLTVAVLLAPDSKWVVLAVSVATALGVHAVPNQPKAAAGPFVPPGHHPADVLPLPDPPMRNLPGPMLPPPSVPKLLAPPVADPPPLYRPEHGHN